MYVFVKEPSSCAVIALSAFSASQAVPKISAGDPATINVVSSCGSPSSPAAATVISVTEIDVTISINASKRLSAFLNILLFLLIVKMLLL